MQATSSAARWAAVPLAIALATAASTAQTQDPPNHWEYLSVTSGVRPNPTPIEVVVWSDFVIVPNTPWMRIYFHDAQLDKGSYLRMTSVLDGAVMLMRQEHLAQWNYTSAYFNGGAVMVELVAGPNTQNNLVDIQRVIAGDVDPSSPAPETICGSTDDRVLSSDPRAGRINPIGCTGWIIDVPSSGVNRAHLSAGHCFGNNQVLQFNVPASNANCGLVFPPPSKQFAIDSATSQSLNTGIGSDWWVFRCFPNSTTGLTSFQEQGAAFQLAAALPANGTTLRNYGYGLDGTNTNGASGGNASCSCSAAAGTGTRNQVQQTHTGPLASVSGNRLNYQFDTCGGNSGSPVINNVTGQAIGIHTNGGCSTTSGSANSGTSILNSALQAAIAAVAPPAVANDECLSATNVVLGVNGPYSSIGASTSSTWPCGGSNAGNDVWFRFTPPCAGTYTFSTCTPTRNFDTTLQVFSGNCLLLTSLGCNDDSCGFGSRLTLNLTGSTVRIRVGGYNGATGNFDLVIEQPQIYDAGPLVTQATGGSGGAPLSAVQNGAPLGMGTFGYSIGGAFSVTDDFATNGTWCVREIELFAYQTGATAASITGVFLEIYDGDPATTGVPIAGSPGFANNLSTTPGYTVTNALTGIYRALQTDPNNTTRQIQSVRVTLPSSLLLNSASIPGGRYFLRVAMTGSVASGPWVPPITVLDSVATGDAKQFNGTTWTPIVSGSPTSGGQGIPFLLYGGSVAPAGIFQNLGGGCSAATLELRGAPHVGGVMHASLVNTDPTAIPLILVGLSDPNSPFSPACPCTLRAALDVVTVGTSYNWQIPMIPSAVGFELFVQGDQVFGPALSCDIGIGFRFELTDGYRVRLY